MTNQSIYGTLAFRYCNLIKKDISSVDCYGINLEIVKGVPRDQTKKLREELKTTYKAIYNTCNMCQYRCIDFELNM